MPLVRLVDRIPCTFRFCSFVNVFFFKQKTAYEMRISDWSSDVCSSDLVLLNWWWFTGGPNGIGNIPRPSFFGLPFERPRAETDVTFSSFFGMDYSSSHRVIFLYYLILALALVTTFFTLRIRQLPVGRAWEALREDETASRALGITPTNRSEEH